MMVVISCLTAMLGIGDIFNRFEHADTLFSQDGLSIRKFIGKIESNLQSTGILFLTATEMMSSVMYKLQT